MLIIFFIFFSFFVNAGEVLRASIGFDLIESTYQNSSLDRKESVYLNPLKEVNRLSIGVTFKPFQSSHLRLTYKSNSLINFANNYKSVAGYEISQKVQSNSFIVSHPVSKYIVPFIVVSDTTSTTKIFNKESTKNSTMYGFGMTYMVNASNGISLTYFLPNSDFGTKKTIVTSYSYFF
jgi:hypothetical protein